MTTTQEHIFITIFIMNCETIHEILENNMYYMSNLANDGKCMSFSVIAKMMMVSKETKFRKHANRMMKRILLDEHVIFKEIILNCRQIACILVPIVCTSLCEATVIWQKHTQDIIFNILHLLLQVPFKAQQNIIDIALFFYARTFFMHRSTEILIKWINIIGYTRTCQIFEHDVAMIEKFLFSVRGSGVSFRTYLDYVLIEQNTMKMIMTQNKQFDLETPNTMVHNIMIHINSIHRDNISILYSILEKNKTTTPNKNEGRIVEYILNTFQHVDIHSIQAYTILDILEEFIQLSIRSNDIIMYDKCGFILLSMLHETSYSNDEIIPLDIECRWLEICYTFFHNACTCTQHITDSVLGLLNLEINRIDDKTIRICICRLISEIDDTSMPCIQVIAIEKLSKILGRVQLDLHNTEIVFRRILDSIIRTNGDNKLTQVVILYIQFILNEKSVLKELNVDNGRNKKKILCCVSVLANYIIKTDIPNTNILFVHTLFSLINSIYNIIIQKKAEEKFVLKILSATSLLVTWVDDFITHVNPITINEMCARNVLHFIWGFVLVGGEKCIKSIFQNTETVYKMFEYCNYENSSSTPYTQVSIKTFLSFLRLYQKYNPVNIEMLARVPVEIIDNVHVKILTEILHVDIVYYRNTSCGVDRLLCIFHHIIEKSKNIAVIDYKRILDIVHEIITYYYENREQKHGYTGDIINRVLDSVMLIFIERSHEITYDIITIFIEVCSRVLYIFSNRTKYPLRLLSFLTNYNPACFLEYVNINVLLMLSISCTKQKLLAPSAATKKITSYVMSGYIQQGICVDFANDVIQHLLTSGFTNSDDIAGTRDLVFK
jgi:hypothetical protein